MAHAKILPADFGLPADVFINSSISKESYTELDSRGLGYLRYHNQTPVSEAQWQEEAEIKRAIPLTLASSIALN
jgi:hypothetical protein